MNKHHHGLCNNCGKSGHQFHQCKMPIISYGMVVFRITPEHGIQYLMIRRKNSFGYIDFMRGKYIANDLTHLQVMFNEMSVEEKNLIKTFDFETLWKIMWGIQPPPLEDVEPPKPRQQQQQPTQFKGEEFASYKKFEAIKNGLAMGAHNEIRTLRNLIDESNTKWVDTEWEFPKGRRNAHEKDLDCALREFEEETGISRRHIHVIENVLPYEEMFLGSNHKSYKHKYFLGYITNEQSVSLQHYQQSEVSKIEWKTLDECLASIRPYNLEKRQLISNINKVLQEYRIY